MIWARTWCGETRRRGGSTVTLSCRGDNCTELRRVLQPGLRCKKSQMGIRTSKHIQSGLNMHPTKLGHPGGYRAQSQKVAENG